MANHFDRSGLRFRDQVALVVGGAQGIGKAIALRLAREAATVVIAEFLASSDADYVNGVLLFVDGGQLA